MPPPLFEPRVFQALNQSSFCCRACGVRICISECRETHSDPIVYRDPDSTSSSPFQSQLSLFLALSGITQFHKINSPALCTLPLLFQSHPTAPHNLAHHAPSRIESPGLISSRIASPPIRTNPAVLGLCLLGKRVCGGTRACVTISWVATTMPTRLEDQYQPQ